MRAVSVVAAALIVVVAVVSTILLTSGGGSPEATPEQPVAAPSAPPVPPPEPSVAETSAPPVPPPERSDAAPSATLDPPLAQPGATTPTTPEAPLEEPSAERASATPEATPDPSAETNATPGAAPVPSAAAETDATPPCENGTAVPSPGDNPGLVADCAILLTVEAGLYVHYELRWDASFSIMQWEGITIGGTPARVQGLEMEGRGLTGRLSPQLGGLSELRILRLGINQLSGAIPAALGALRNLQTLHLDRNDLTGAIPVELGSLRNLSSLQLSDNQLTGPIPVELGALSSLQTLRLDGNQLSGAIPPALGNLRNLESLWLSANQLSGPIPAEMGTLDVLKSLALDHNQLSGPIPATLGVLRGLRILHLNGNDLTGAIPAALGSLPVLRSLSLQENQLSGAIPGTLGALRSLEHLWLHENRLTVAIPAALAGLYNLESLWLYENQLTGAIPAALGALHALETLRLHGNQLSGAIPAALGGLSNLAFLYLHDNQLRGAIPTALGTLRNLGFLRLNDNHLSSAIPGTLGALPYLRDLYLGGNAGLTGCIPSMLRELPGNDLAALGLADCALETAPPPTEPPTEPPDPEAAILPYNRLDTTGAATTPGSYAFLDGAASAITTYEGLRQDAVGLRIHQTDADGTSRPSIFGTVAVGDIFEWRQADDCWIRYQVTARLPDPPGTAPRKHFAIKWAAYAGTGCTGAVAVDTAASVTWDPPSFFSPTITTPVRYGPYQLIPFGWTGAIEAGAPVTPPSSRASGASDAQPRPEWPSDDPAVVRQHPLWAEPTVPTGWQLGGLFADETFVEAIYADSDGYFAARCWISRVAWLPRDTTAGLYSRPNAGEEVRTIDGHPAIVKYSLGGSSVRIFDETTGTEYFVHLYSSSEDPDGRDLEDAIAIARSLYQWEGSRSSPPRASVRSQDSSTSRSLGRDATRSRR